MARPGSLLNQKLKMGIPGLDTLTAGLKALAAIFGFAQKRTELNNSPEMQKAKAQQTQVKTNDDISKTVATGSDDANRINIAP